LKSIAKRIRRRVLLENPNYQITN
jgi:hypothetical protein